MPKITKTWMKVDNEDFQVEIHYNQKRKFYIAGMPECVRLVTGVSFQGCESESALNKLIFETLRDYHESVKKTRKVIVYSVDVTAAITMKPDKGCGGYSGYKAWVPGAVKHADSEFMRFKHGSGFVLEWKVKQEVTGKDTKYFALDDDGNIYGSSSRLSKEEMVIDWSEEREQGFREIDRSMEEMVKRLALILCDTEKVKLLMDGGKLLLPHAAEAA